MGTDAGILRHLSETAHTHAGLPDMSSLPRHPPSLQSLSLSDRPPRFTHSVAVIGAGAAGLVAARELRREGHRVVVFERRDRAGGTWVYDTGVESDPLGLDPSREIVHSSLYESLRTNLPRECMGFLDFPFVPRGVDCRDPRRFPGHREVLRYLEDFAGHFDLYGLVRFGTEVVEVGVAGEGGWTVKSRRVAGGSDTNEVYDAVVVCNGHFTEPRIADIPGIDVWPGKQMHSHNYRVPQPFLDQVVVLIGYSSSAADISRDIAGFAKEVHVASRLQSSGTPVKQIGYDNIWHHTMVSLINLKLLFLGACGHYFSVQECVIISLSESWMYKYNFPFLKTNGHVTVDDNRVGPLYKHIFPPSLAPWLSFIGIPWKVVPFPLFELQSKWVAAALSGQIELPTQETMMDDVKASYKEIEAAGWPQRYTHNISKFQFEYDDWLAAECGYPAVEEWRKEMYIATSKNKQANPDGYRNEWEDDHLRTQAMDYFREHWSDTL